MKLDMTIFADTQETRAFLKKLDAKIIEHHPLKCQVRGPGAYSLGGFILEVSEERFKQHFYEMEDTKQFFPHEDITPNADHWHSSTWVRGEIPNNIPRVVNGWTRRMLRDKAAREKRLGICQ
jgi:hypothetical protein